MNVPTKPSRSGRLSITMSLTGRCAIDHKEEYETPTPPLPHNEGTVTSVPLPPRKDTRPFMNGPTATPNIGTLNITSRSIPEPNLMIETKPTTHPPPHRAVKTTSAPLHTSKNLKQFVNSPTIFPTAHTHSGDSSGSKTKKSRSIPKPSYLRRNSPTKPHEDKKTVVHTRHIPVIFPTFPTAQYDRVDMDDKKKINRKSRTAINSWQELNSKLELVKVTDYGIAISSRRIDPNKPKPKPQPKPKPKPNPNPTHTQTQTQINPNPNKPNKMPNAVHNTMHTGTGHRDSARAEHHEHHHHERVLRGEEDDDNHRIKKMRKEEDTSKLEARPENMKLTSKLVKTASSRVSGLTPSKLKRLKPATKKPEQTRPIKTSGKPFVREKNFKALLRHWETSSAAEDTVLTQAVTYGGPSLEPQQTANQEADNRKIWKSESSVRIVIGRKTWQEGQITNQGEA